MSNSSELSRSKDARQMKILLTERLIEPVDDAGLRILRQVGDVKLARGISEDQLIDDIRDADAIVVRLARITGKVIENAPRLKVIARTGVGVDNIDVTTATEKGVMVVNSPMMNTNSVAEYVLCLVLAQARNLLRFDREQKKGNWTIRDELLPRNLDLAGKTLGIVGLGTIGGAVARKAKCLDMRIIYTDAIRKTEVERELGIEYVDFESLLKESDFITLHVTLDSGTYHMFREKEFRSMKKGSYFINTSRGAVVDEKSLHTALTNNWIAGAAIDVFDLEPPSPDSDLFGLENLITTPHVAGHTIDSRTKMMVILAKDVAKALNGEKPANLVNKDALETEISKLKKN